MNANRFRFKNPKRAPREKLKLEETANQVTHGLGAVFSIFALIFLYLRAQKFNDIEVTVSYLVFGISLLLLYSASLFYHLAESPKLKRITKTLDHCGIYVLIAGTYTPFMVSVLKSTSGLMVLYCIWALALFGIIFKIFFAHKFKILSTLIYLFMGWAVIAVWSPLVAVLPTQSFSWLLAGGIAYTGGVVFYLWDRLKFHHAIWHLFVLAGSLCHFIAVRESSIN